MADENAATIRTIEARCRIIAADLEARGLTSQHESMVSIADSLRTNVRTAQWTADPMVAGPSPMSTHELSDLGTDENPRPTEEQIMGQQPSAGSMLDPARATQRPTETGVRKWFVRLSDIMAEDENSLLELVKPIAAELGALVADYGEEKARTRTPRTA